MGEIGNLSFFVISHSCGCGAGAVTQRASFASGEWSAKWCRDFFLLSCLIQPLSSHFSAGEKSHFPGRTCTQLLCPASLLDQSIFGWKIGREQHRTRGSGPGRWCPMSQCGHLSLHLVCYHVTFELWHEKCFHLP